MVKNQDSMTVNESSIERFGENFLFRVDSYSACYVINFIMIIFNLIFCQNMLVVWFIWAVSKTMKYLDEPVKRISLYFILFQISSKENIIRFEYIICHSFALQSQTFNQFSLIISKRCQLLTHISPVMLLWDLSRGIILLFSEILLKFLLQCSNSGLTLFFEKDVNYTSVSNIRFCCWPCYILTVVSWILMQLLL